MASGEQKIVGFAEDLGKLLGTAQAKAEGWLGQRKQIAKTLAGIRDTATKLLTQIGEETRSVISRRRGRPPAFRSRSPAKGSNIFLVDDSVTFLTYVFIVTMPFG